MINEFSTKISKIDTTLTPDDNNIFEKGNTKRMCKIEKVEFHNSVAREMFVVKRARPDIHQIDTVLLTRFKEPDETDWKQLARMIKYLNGKKRN